jgi:hypothetical protein
MSAKTLIRSIRDHFQTVVIWAMVPLAAVSGQSISGCLSADGKFDPNCQCWSGPATSASQSAESNQTAVVHPCHCSCCGTANCCCKQKSHAGNSQACHSNRSSGKDVQTNGHCRPFAVFAAVTAVNSAQQTSVEREPLNLLAPVNIDALVGINCSASERIVESGTGPPPDNLMVTLHRWVI